MIAAEVTNDVKIEVITPDIAHELLKFNTNNRKVSNVVVQIYAQSMKDNKWPFTGHPIVFGKSGKLLDGQHRLLAVIKSNTSQSFVIVRGVTNEDQVFAAIDTGKIRSAADVLSKEGFSDSALYASVVKRIIIYGRFKDYGAITGLKRLGGMTTSSTSFVSNDQVREWAEQNDISLEISIGRHLSKQGAGIMSPTDFCFFYWLFSAIDNTCAMDFLTRLATGYNLSEGSPIAAFRRKLEVYNRQFSRPMDSMEKLHVCIRAWNDFRLGKKVNRYNYSRDSLMPRPI